MRRPNGHHLGSGRQKVLATGSLPATRLFRTPLALLLASSMVLGNSAVALAKTGGAQTQETKSRTSETKEQVVKSDKAVNTTDSSGTGSSDAADTTAKKSKKHSSHKKRRRYSAKKAKRLKREVRAACDASGMDVGVAIYDLTNGMPVGVHGKKRFVSASMIKMLIASALLQRVDEGSLSLDDTYELQSEDIVGGTGWIASYGVGAKVSYGELLRTMINASDNTSTNALISSLGFDAINDEAKRLGLKKTRLNRRMMDSEAVAAGIENYTCAKDLALIYRKTYNGTLASPELCKVLMQALEEQQDAGGILSGLPGGTTFAHKTGTLATARHDGGIVEGEHPYVIVVLCGGSGYWEQGALDTMANVARIVDPEIRN